MTGPDELRKSCRQVRARPQGLRLDPDAVEAAADAWEKDKKVAQYAIADLGKMQARIEELERAIFDRVKRLEAAEKKAAEWAGWCESHKIAIDVYATDNADLRQRLEAAERLLTDVRESAVEFRDPRIGYVTVQIDRGTWDALAGEKP